MKEQLPDSLGNLNDSASPENETIPKQGEESSLFIDESKVMECLNRGGEEAMISFFQLYYSPLCYFAERMVHDRQVAEDVVEDCFMKLWKKHTDFETVQNVKAFLYISTRNACLNILKQWQRDAASRRELAYLTGEEDDYVLNSIVRTEVIAEIYHLIEKLPPQSKKVLKMSVFDNMRNHEIAAALEVSIHTVKNQKMRAMQILRMNLFKNSS